MKIKDIFEITVIVIIIFFCATIVLIIVGALTKYWAYPILDWIF